MTVWTQTGQHCLEAVVAALISLSSTTRQGPFGMACLRTQAAGATGSGCFRSVNFRRQPHDKTRPFTNFRDEGDGASQPVHQAPHDAQAARGPWRRSYRLSQRYVIFKEALSGRGVGYRWPFIGHFRCAKSRASASSIVHRTRLSTMSSCRAELIALLIRLARICCTARRVGQDRRIVSPS